MVSRRIDTLLTQCYYVLASLCLCSFFQRGPGPAGADESQHRGAVDDRCRGWRGPSRYRVLVVNCSAEDDDDNDGDDNTASRARGCGSRCYPANDGDDADDAVVDDGGTGVTGDAVDDKSNHISVTVMIFG